MLNALAEGESGNSETHDLPRSLPTLGSIGSIPNSGKLLILANSDPPPELKIFVHSVQCGQTNLKQVLILELHIQLLDPLTHSYFQLSLKCEYQSFYKM